MSVGCYSSLRLNLRTPERPTTFSGAQRAHSPTAGMLVASRVTTSEWHTPSRKSRGKAKAAPSPVASDVKAAVVAESSVTKAVQKLTVASVVEVVTDDDWQISVPSKNDECTPVAPPVCKSCKYTLSNLLALRCRWRMGSVPVQDGEDYSRYPEKEESLDSEEESTVVPFRSQPTGKRAISFHVDMDVPSNCIVNVLNVDSKVEWPMLNTFCAKTIGVKPLSIRMQRRTNPGSAHLLFSTAEDATSFLERVPAGARLKGRKLRFLRNNASLPGGVKGKSGRAQGHTQSVETAVVCEVAQNDTPDDDCCGKQA